MRIPITFRRALLFAAVALLFAAGNVSAQSAGDKFYNEGLKLQKTMTVPAQNSAISKFSSARKIYDSAQKKSQCDAAIQVSRNIIKSLTPDPMPGPAPKPKKRKKDLYDEEPAVPEPSRAEWLRLGEERVQMGYKPGTVEVKVDASGHWDAAPVTNADGTSFVTVSAAGDMLEIRCGQNNGPRRAQQVIVKCGDKSKTLAVAQKGLPVDFAADRQAYLFKTEGGRRKIKVACNGGMSYSENKGHNWRVVSAPDWATVITEGKWKVDKKAYGPAPMLVSEFMVNCTGLGVGSALSTNGRRGTLLLESGDTRIAISLDQPGIGGMLPRISLSSGLEDYETEVVAAGEETSASFASGVRITSIGAGSDAGKLGFAKGDIITEVDGRPVRCVADLTEAMNRHRPDELVKFTFIRNGKRYEKSGYFSALRPDYDL